MRYINPRFTYFTYLLLFRSTYTHVDIQMLDWMELLYPTRAVWKSITIDSGEQYAMITSTTLMPALYATVLDSGLYYSVSINVNVSQFSVAKTAKKLLQSLYRSTNI